MKQATIIKMQTLVLVAMLAAYTPASLAQKAKPAGGAKSQTAAAAAPDATPKSPCGNQTFCYDTADFTATIAQFRTSTDGSGNKMLDAIVHFQNKTDQVLSLGYADGSAESIDDHGNRFELNKNGVRGMGTVTGTTPDAKFVLQPNGTGDARFELLWNPKDQIAGATYELEMSIREMSRGDDKQWTLGNESLLHYDGLANGSASAAAPAGTPGATPAASAVTATASSNPTPAAGSASASNLANSAASASQPCAPGTANSAVSSTSAAITSISTLFGHKKTLASAPPCSTTANGASGSGSTAAKASTAAQPAATTAPATTSAAATKPAPAAQPGVVNASLRQPVATTASPKAPASAATPPKATPATAAKKPPVVPAAKKPTPVSTTASSTGGAQ